MAELPLSHSLLIPLLSGNDAKQQARLMEEAAQHMVSGLYANVSQNFTLTITV